MVEGQGPVTPGNRRKRIGAEDEIDVEALKGFFLLESGENHRLRFDLLRLLAERKREKGRMGLAEQGHE